MSTTVPKLFLQFNQTFAAARMDDNPKEFPKYVQKLLALQDAIQIQAKKTSSLPDKITSTAALSEELAAKIDMLFQRDAKKTLPPKPSASPLVSCVGFGNVRSANCWAISLLQFILNRPDLLQAWNRISEYYASGNHLDTGRVQAVVDHFHQGLVTEARFSAGEALFNKISAPYLKLAALDQLIKDGRRNIAIGLRSHLSDAHNAALNRLTSRMPFAQAIAALLQAEAPREEQRLQQLRLAGKSFRDAITIYNQAIAGAQLTGQPSQPIPTAVAQNVRLAFHTLFGTHNPITGATIFSDSSGAHEDAHEALQFFMGRFEEISRVQGYPLTNYSVLETIRINQATTEAPTPINPNFPREALEPGGISRARNLEYQLILQPTATHDQPLETLLARYFCAPAAPGTDPSYYQSAHNPFLQQSYRLIEERRRFMGNVPQTFTMVVKRFGMDMMGQPYKIHTRVMVNRFITMPANAMQANDRDRAYELRSFVSHSGDTAGGHYISYKKLPDGGWVECNDDLVNRLNDAQIDAILHGSTPYMLDYRLVAPAQQQAMLDLAAQLRARGPIRPPAFVQPPSLANKELVVHQQIIDQLAKLAQLLQKPESTNKEFIEVFQRLHNLSSICLPLLARMTALHNKKMQESEGLKLLYSNPKQLSSIRTNWIRISTNDIIGQLIRSEQEKFAIRKAGLALTALEKLTTTPGTTQAQLDAFKKKELEFNQLIHKYNLENLRTFHALIKNQDIGNEQLKLLLQNDLDIPEAWIQRLYAAIEKATGKKDGKAQFEENPRILCQPSQDLLEQFITSY